MNIRVLTIGIFIIIISLIIYFVKNSKEILNDFEKIKNRNIFKILKIILIILLGVIIVYLMGKAVNKLYIGIDYYKSSKENNKMFEIADNKILTENNFYKAAMEKDYENQNSKIPYIPNGFKKLEGEWNTGFVIQDENGNEYVWIPCTNRDDAEIIKLQRNNYLEFDRSFFISKDNCYNEEYEKFINSALENGGFYISRYEIGIENNKPVSKPGVEVLSDVTRKEAENIINQMYDNINCELINGYAYDTTLSWITKNNDINFYKIDASDNKKIYTGRNKNNNIFDFIDNILEFSLETNYDTVVIRGFAYENSIEGRSRYTILNDDKFFDYMSLIALRTVIYK